MPHPDESIEPTATRPARAAGIWMAAIGSAVVVALLLVIGANAGDGASPAPDALPPGMNSATADLLGVSPLGSDPVMAPSFELLDESGTPTRSADFRGRALIVTFNDDRCTDLCALLASDIIRADRDLSTAARGRVAFVSINANPYYTDPDDTRAWSREHGLDALPNWYFLTGTPEQLAAVAKDFGVPIESDPATKEVEHGTQIFVISPDGHEAVARASFGAQSADTEPFAHGLATLADDALPEDQRTPVAGHNLTASIKDGTDLGGTPEPIVGNALQNHDRLSTADARGDYTVLDFWASTCTACGMQLQNLKAAAGMLGGKVAFYGIDVEDSIAAGTATLSRYGVTVPTMRDPTGVDAARFRVADLPYTIILSPGGTVLIRHPGVFTADELTYTLHELDPSLPDADG